MSIEKRMNGSPAQMETVIAHHPCSRFALWIFSTYQRHPNLLSAGSSHGIHRVAGSETKSTPAWSKIPVDEEGAFRELPCNLQKGLSSSRAGPANLQVIPRCGIAAQLLRRYAFRPLKRCQASSPPGKIFGPQALRHPSPVLPNLPPSTIIAQAISENSSEHTEPPVACVLTAILCSVWPPRTPYALTTSRITTADG